MYLCVGAFFQPETYIFVDEDGLVQLVHEFESPRVGYDFYCSEPIDHVLDKFAAAGIHANDIQQIVFAYKPFLQFERFLTDMYLNFSLENLVRFSDGINFFFSKGLRVRKIYGEAFPQCQDFWFVSSLCAVPNWCQFLPLDGPLLIKGLPTEFNSDLIYSGAVGIISTVDSSIQQPNSVVSFTSRKASRRFGETCSGTHSWGLPVAGALDYVFRNLDVPIRIQEGFRESIRTRYNNFLIPTGPLWISN